MKRVSILAALALFMLFAGTASAALPAVVAGYVTNAATGKPVAGAKVSIKGQGTAKSAANGAYLITVAPGYVTLCSVATGFTNTCKPGFTAVSGQTTRRNITMAPVKK